MNQTTKLTHKKPYIYQEVDGKRVEIDGIYKIYDENTYGFQVASYNKTYPLIIDPVLVYSTYLGGSGDDQMWSDMEVDGAGNVYVRGITPSSDFPTKNAFQPNYSGGSYDAFVAKIDASGQLVYSTYLGGSGLEWVGSIAIDSTGNAFVTGFTGSFDFPTKNAFQSNSGGFWDAFVAKINSSGELVYSTYLGGGNNDAPSELAVDSAGNVYVSGWTYSSDFPTKNAFQPNFGGENDGFITKVDASGQLAYSTYLGGRGDDYGGEIALAHLPQFENQSLCKSMC